MDTTTLLFSTSNLLDQELHLDDRNGKGGYGKRNGLASIGGKFGITMMPFKVSTDLSE